ncbi:MAG: sugar nucleotide-binding protein [Desulfocapsa sp.]|nr:sugar nucleotide-binding protein [Desulfocapsa sp.]
MCYSIEHNEPAFSETHCYEYNISCSACKAPSDHLVRAYHQTYDIVQTALMKILLLGANGQVGWELQRSLASLGQLKACGRKEADLGNLKNLRATIRRYSPNLIANAAAYTAVDRAESEPDIARRVNATAVALLAGEAKHLGALLIHYSTDYIFNGKKTAPYIETDQPNALNVYGKTRLQGEETIWNSGCKHLIFRTSWVYASRGSNFVRTMIIRLARAPLCQDSCLTLSDNAEFLYKTTDYYAPEFERSIMWNDPAINIQWPTDLKPILSAEDQHATMLNNAEVFA